MIKYCRIKSYSFLLFKRDMVKYTIKVRFWKEKIIILFRLTFISEEKIQLLFLKFIFLKYDRA